MEAGKPESRRGGTRERWRRPPLFPCVTISAGLPTRAGCGWDKIRQSVEAKRFPSVAKRYHVEEVLVDRVYHARRNAITGAGVREYDHAALDGVREAVRWWRDLHGCV